MLAPSIFNDNFDLFDRFFDDPWLGFSGREMRDPAKKLCGHRSKSSMCTDIKETENGYEMTIDLPGFEKDEVNVELEKGYLTISATKNFSDDFEDEKKKMASILSMNATVVPAEEASM